MFGTSPLTAEKNKEEQVKINKDVRTKWKINEVRLQIKLHRTFLSSYEGMFLV